MKLSETQKNALYYVDHRSRHSAKYASKDCYSVATYRALAGRGLIEIGVRSHFVDWRIDGKKTLQLIEPREWVSRITPKGIAFLKERHGFQ